MKRLIVLCAALLGAFAFAQQVDPAKVLQQIEATTRAAIDAASKDKKDIDYDALQAARKSAAEAAVKDVDPKTVKLDQALDWASLYETAEQYANMRTVLDRYAASETDPEKRFAAQLRSLQASSSLKDGQRISTEVAALKPTTASQAAQLANAYAGYIGDAIYASKGLDAAIKGVADRRAEIAANSAGATDDVKLRLDAARYGLAMIEFELYSRAGKNAEAVKAAQAAAKDLGETTARGKNLLIQANQVAVLNTSAPAIAAEQQLGAYTSLADLKGKVVLLDFFAHWCGPCIASFPEMAQLYKDLVDKGVAIVGVTRFYGFYQKENATKRDMPKDVELDKVKQFAGQYGLVWPIIYAPTSAYEDYGVTGIPHVVLIDKKGVVRKIRVGYDPDTWAAFRAEVEKLLTE